MTRSADFYADGQWNFFCDLCGRKAKSDDGVKTWNSLYVCRHHKEIRNEQDFIRGVKENMSVPWSRPEGPEIFIGTVCQLWDRSCYADLGTADCAIADNLTQSYQFLVNLKTGGSGTDPPMEPPFFYCNFWTRSAFPGYSGPGCSIPGQTQGF